MNENQNNNQTVQKEEDLNALMKVRREKLAALQEAGNDPFAITKYEVTHHGETIKENLKARKFPSPEE